MPAIDRNSNLKKIPAKKVVKPRPASPRPQGMSRGFTPKGKVKAAPPTPKKVAVRPAGTLSKTFKTDNAAGQGYRKDQHTEQTIRDNILKARKTHARRTSPKHVQRVAEKKYGIEGQQKAINKVRESLSLLHDSDPAEYARNLAQGKHASIDDVKNDLKLHGPTLAKGAGEGATKIKKALDYVHDKTSSPGQRQMEKSGLAPDPTKLAKEATDLVAETPAGIYMASKAAKDAATGDTTAAKGMWKDFKDTSAVAALAGGHVKEAVKRANERPITTALELSGAKAVLGRGAGMAARAGVAGKAGKEFASAERAPLRLYQGSKPGEGPAVERRHSKDLISNRVAKASDKRKAKRGIDPNVYREPTVKNLSGGTSRITPRVGPGKHPIDDRVDRHVHAQHVVQQQAKAAAERKAARRGKGDETPVNPHADRDAAKEITNKNPRVNGLDPKAVSHQAHDVLDIKKPVIVRLMPASRVAELKARLGKEPRGYTSVEGDHYKIELNPNHPGNKGPRGLSDVLHYELGRVQGEERGLVGPGEVGSNKKAYFNNPNTKHAQQVLRTHIRTDLHRTPPQLPERQFTGSEAPTNRDLAGQRAAQAVQAVAMRKAVDDLGIGKPVSTHQEVLLKKAAAEAKYGEPMTPINAGRLTRIWKEPVVAQKADPHGLRVATSQERAWSDAVNDHRDGKWILMPTRVVNRFAQHAENSKNYGPVQRTTNQFKDVVLTTSNPVRWLGGNVTDLGMRSAFEGLTPPDLYRGARVHRELSRRGEKGKLAQAATMGGGFGHLARDVTGELDTPGVGHLAKAWGHYRSAVYGIESAIESLPQMAKVGKEMRQGVPATARGGLKNVLRATDEQVQQFATKMTTDPAKEMQIAKGVEDVIGKWGKLSPEARKMLAFAPFAQWLGAATKYVLITLPVKHPIKTGLIAAIGEMTEKERMSLGLSQWLPLDKQAQDYQMMTLPQSVTKDKYGPVVKGTDMARALSFGTVKDALDLNVGGFLFPQFTGALDAARGTSWTGEPLVYPEGSPNAGMPLSGEDKRKTAIGMMIETMLPFGSSFRRIYQEGGQPSLPQSTILDPQVRQKFDTKTKKLETPKGSLGEGLARFVGSPIPGLATPKRVYTKGAINKIGRSRIRNQENAESNKRRAAESAKNRDPEIGAFGTAQPRKSKDQESTNLGGKQPRTGKNVDPELEAFK